MLRLVFCTAVLQLVKQLIILAQDKTSSFALQVIGYYPGRLWDTYSTIIEESTIQINPYYQLTSTNNVLSIYKFRPINRFKVETVRRAEFMKGTADG